MLQRSVKFVSLSRVCNLNTVGRQNNDVQLINEVLSNSFNVMVKSLAYIILALVILFLISAKLVLVLFAGLFILSLFSGVLRRQTS